MSSQMLTVNKNLTMSSSKTDEDKDKTNIEENDIKIVVGQKSSSKEEPVSIVLKTSDPMPIIKSFKNKWEKKLNDNDDNTASTSTLKKIPEMRKKIDDIFTKRQHKKGSFPVSFRKKQKEESHDDFEKDQKKANTKANRTVGNLLNNNIVKLANSKKNAKDVEEDKIIEENFKFVYDVDLNILLIHNIIIKKFSQKEEKIEAFKKEKEGLKRRLTENRITKCTKNEIINKIIICNNEINKLNKDESLKKYISESKDYIDKYMNIGPLKKFKRLHSQRIKLESDEASIVRRTIISKYLEIANQYIDLNIEKVLRKDHMCSFCEAPLKDIEPNEKGFVICKNCNCENILNFNEKYKAENSEDGELYKNKSSKDDGSENFAKALNDFLCNQSSRYPEDLFDLLTKHFKNFANPPLPEIVSKRDVNIYGEKIGTNRDMMDRALNSIGKPDLYSHTRMICHLYWGWDPPNISSDIIESIWRDYYLFSNTYKSIAKEFGERKSVLNSQYLLFRLLQKNKVMCKTRQFKIPRTPNILNYHEDVYFRCCGILQRDDPLWKPGMALTENDI